jgi:hypothetical protein
MKEAHDAIARSVCHGRDHSSVHVAGVFAPGHLGELTQYVPFELVDDVVGADQEAYS